jgi:hypothetical protein
MNRKISLTILSLIIIAALLMAGCGSSPATVSANSGLSMASKDALGILKLEGTTNAVTASQAKELLTLWQVYQSISSSDTASQVELDALVKQIEDTLTSEQVKAIQAMNLSEQSLSEAMSSLAANASTGTSTTSTQGQSSASSSLNSMPSGGLGSSASGSSSETGGMPSGGPGGAPPNGSGGMPGGDSSGVSDILNGTNSQGTAVATQNTPGAAIVQVNPILLRAVIQLLETRSQSAG